jgi:alkanesulfonate monooxygenase SsuD/methylene tetrahydromethanopterin reductase-like flavin-dependent oxidoreductase (luciferase family)
MKAAIALRTEKLRIGTSVADPHRIHPAIMAHLMLSLDLLSCGRVFLGLGAGEAMNLNPFGIRWDEPVSRMREALEVIRGLYRATPEIPFNYKGKFFRLKDAFLQVKPVQRPYPPIWIAGNAPKTRALTGEFGDGWLPQHLDPATYLKHLSEIEGVARVHGRNIEEIETAYELIIGISEDAEAARSAISEVGRLVFLWGRPSLLKELGYDVEIPQDFSAQLSAEQMTVTRYSKLYPQLRRTIEAIPFEAAEKINACGTPDDVIEKIEEYTMAGCRAFMCCIMGPDHDKAIKLFSSKVIPYFKESRRK